MKFSRVFRNHYDLRLKMQFALFAVSLPIYCRWHNLIIRLFFFFFCSASMPNLSSMCSAFYLIIICVFFVSLCLSFFWSCDACVQSDRCLDIPWNWIRRSYWTYCNWIACSSSHWESSELNWEFHLMSHLLYILVYSI